MHAKYIYSILLLLLVIFVSQIFAVILSIPVLIEGLSECLPNCEDISLNLDTSKEFALPDCKKVNAKLLTSADASEKGNPQVQSFISKINSHVEQQYQFSKLFLPLKNTNTGVSGIKNMEQININKTFTDFSGIVHHTHQDILDNMVNDPTFDSTITTFKYSLDKDNPSDEVKTSIKQKLSEYKKEREKDTPAFSSVYMDFIKGLSNMLKSIQDKCKDYYTDQNLQTIVDDHLKYPKYYDNKSSFHLLDSYINDAVLNKLGEV